MRFTDDELGQIVTAVRDALADRPDPIAVTVPKAAKVLGTSPEHVRILIDEGRLPVVPHMPRQVIAVAALEAFAAGGVASPGEGSGRPHTSRPGGASSPSAATEGPVRPLRATDPSAGDSPSAA